MLQRCIIFSILVLPLPAHAGFDIGPVGNAMFWVGLALWSAGVAWSLFTHREYVGHNFARIIRIVLARPARPKIIVGAPRSRPVVSATYRADAALSAAQSFLHTSTLGVADVLRTSPHSALVSLVDAKRASERALSSYRKHIRLPHISSRARSVIARMQTSLSERFTKKKKTHEVSLARALATLETVSAHRAASIQSVAPVSAPAIVPVENVSETHPDKVEVAQDMLPQQVVHDEESAQESLVAPVEVALESVSTASPRMPVQAVITPTLQVVHPEHTREKVRVLTHAQRALIRARHAQEHLPAGNGEGSFQGSNQAYRVPSSSVDRQKATTTPVRELQLLARPQEVATHQKEKAIPQLAIELGKKMNALLPEKVRSAVPASATSAAFPAASSAAPSHKGHAHDHSMTAHHAAQNAAKESTKNVQPVILASGVTADSLVLDTTSGTPRLILTRN